jgi:dTMP kinase
MENKLPSSRDKFVLDPRMSEDGLLGFITFEGCECSGKSTQSKLLYDWLISKGKKAILTKEPGGTKSAEELRLFLLNKDKKLDPRSEALLHIAARVEHVTDIILPALKEGITVICDRFADSTLAYQAYGHGISADFINLLHKNLLNDIQPSITFILDINLATFKERLKAKHAASANNDRYEAMSEDFHVRVMNAFRKIAEQNPDRCVLIDANEKSIQNIHEEIVQRLTFGE